MQQIFDSALLGILLGALLSAIGFAVYLLGIQAIKFFAGLTRSAKNAARSEKSRTKAVQTNDQITPENAAVNAMTERYLRRATAKNLIS